MLFTGKKPIALQDHYWTNRWVSRVIGITSIYPLWLWNVLLRLEGCSLADACGCRTRVVTCVDNVILHFVASFTVNTPFLVKSEYVCRELRCDLSLHRLPSVGKSMKRMCKKKEKDVERRRWRGGMGGGLARRLPQDCPHLQKSALFCHCVFFSLRCQMRSGGTNVAAFQTPTLGLHTQITRGHPGDRWGRPCYFARLRLILEN